MDKRIVQIPVGLDLNKLMAPNERPVEIISTLVSHDKILERLLSTINPINFRELAGLGEDEKPRTSHYHVITVEQVLNLAELQSWGLCQNHEFIYLYNGAFWKKLESDTLKSFLGKAAEKLGVEKHKARHYTFKDALFKQFMASANLPRPELPKDIVLINLKNGTFEISPNGVCLRPFNAKDFLTYQLPFEYNQEAGAPIFFDYLHKVQPDQERQLVLAEYLGYVFIKNGTLKLEKALFLYGTGANGKSVFHEVVKAMLGEDNTSQYPLQDLTNENGYYRAMIANKLVNYATEISGKLQSSTFKQLVSGETVSARLPYGNPFEISEYAKLIFNVNELPKDVEQTDAFFRRFLIVPFEVTIQEEDQDKQLHIKIIRNELSGVFNWVLLGLDRLLKQKQFSVCHSAQAARERYKLESDSVKLFLDEDQYEVSLTRYIPLKEVYNEYKYYCLENGYIKCSLKSFSDRLKGVGYQMQRKSQGNIVWIQKKVLF